MSLDLGMILFLYHEGLCAYFLAQTNSRFTGRKVLFLLEKVTYLNLEIDYCVPYTFQLLTFVNFCEISVLNVHVDARVRINLQLHSVLS